MARVRKPLTVYLLPAVRAELKKRSVDRRKPEATIAAEVLTREFLLPPTGETPAKLPNLTPAPKSR